MAKCPKNPRVELMSMTLMRHLSAQHCPECQGHWIPNEQYEAWREYQPQPQSTHLPQRLDLDFEPSPLDTRAALCPECRCYLARAKVSLSKPFFIERCPNCNGIWCDRGEWEVLEKMGMHTAVEQLFSNEWQGRVRELTQAEQERRATIDKLGEDLAYRVFALAEALENHPNGDFGVAYLMRRFDK